MQQASRQKLGIFIIIIGLLIVIAIIYFGFLKPAAPTAEVTPNTAVINGQLPTGTNPAVTTTSETPRAVVNYDVTKEAPHKVNVSDVTRIAMAFAERFGSYSNQSSYGNFTDLKIMMTNNMKNWADNYVTGLKASNTNSSVYYGITTNALTNETKNFDDASGVAQIIVSTKRQENTEALVPSPAYVQKLDLDFKKVNGEWLVDRAYWEK